MNAGSECDAQFACDTCLATMGCRWCLEVAPLEDRKRCVKDSGFRPCGLSSSATSMDKCVTCPIKKLKGMQVTEVNPPSSVAITDPTGGYSTEEEQFAFGFAKTASVGTTTCSNLPKGSSCKVKCSNGYFRDAIAGGVNVLTCGDNLQYSSASLITCARFPMTLVLVLVMTVLILLVALFCYGKRRAKAAQQRAAYGFGGDNGVALAPELNVRRRIRLRTAKTFDGDCTDAGLESGSSDVSLNSRRSHHGRVSSDHGDNLEGGNSLIAL